MLTDLLILFFLLIFSGDKMATYKELLDELARWEYKELLAQHSLEELKELKEKFEAHRSELIKALEEKEKKGEFN